MKTSKTFLTNGESVSFSRLDEIGTYPICHLCKKRKPPAAFRPGFSACIECEGGKRIYVKYSALRVNARARGIVFSISPEQFRSWTIDTPETCFYCGVTGEQHLRDKAAIMAYKGRDRAVTRYREFMGDRAYNSEYMTIDRRDNGIGYVAGNLVKACWPCNSLKGSFLLESEAVTILPLVYANTRRVLDGVPVTRPADENKV